MKLIHCTVFLQTISAILCFYDRASKMVFPHVETYWESWTEGGPDFANNLIDVPITPIGSKQGVNIVNVAFAMPGYGSCYEAPIPANCTLLPGYQGKEDPLRQAVRHIHEHNGFVKIAIGGDTYGNPKPGNGLYAYWLAKQIDDYGLDGVDFVVKEWQPEWVFNQTDLARMIGELRLEMPNKIISVTVPACTTCWNPLLEASEPDLDYVTVFRARSNNIAINHVPNHKIVWGIMLTQDCLMTTTLEAATVVRDEGYTGVSTWSINSDTAQRGDYEYAECNQYQTGHEDASYINMISYLLNA